MNDIITREGYELQQAQRIISPEYFLRFAAFIDAKPKTVETYTRALRQMYKFFVENEISLSQPTREDIIRFREYLKDTGHKPTTVTNYITAIRLYFQWLEAERIYPNVSAHLKGCKLDREHKKDYLTSKQIKAVLADIDQSSLQGLRNYAIVTLTTVGALRTCEVSRANIGDLRTLGDDTVLYIQGKGRDERSEFVKVPEPVEAAIRAYLKMRGESSPDAPLFASTSNNSKGKRMTTRSISGICKGAMVEAGFNSTRWTAHSLRHSGITLSLLSGQKLEETQQFARHANIATTMIYNHALDKAKNGCSEAISKSIF